MASSHTVVWQTARVEGVSRVADRVQRILLRPDRPRPTPPGAHVDVRLRLAERTLERSYSIVEPVGEEGAFALSVFRSETSRGGAVAMHALRPGDTVEVTEPLQDFAYRGGREPVVFLAGGVGITALVQMARAARESGRPYRLAYCGRSAAAMPYFDDLRREHGALLEPHIRDESTGLDVAAFVASVPTAAELYVCGPIRLMDAVRREWLAAERKPAQLRFETFGNSGWFAPEPFTVRIPATGVSCRVSPDQTLLEALEAAGVDALSDCRKGECGLCEARVLGLQGRIDHRDVFYSERQRDAESKICICVSRLVGQEGAAPEIELLLS
ncbi:PDR/VanB family oxidoreductase [Microbacterium oleivorans]|uniref:PDR/VanB family oxidoreductase n=1 Tax=Microbacterium oleivorans TaxID=273677 RepID=UPI0007671B3F|nr:PDR/VanB family oxidoreductase [Microbacterium oleivorans]THE07706.1 oxidoreductase [Microbacterium oleivorans]